VAVEGGEKCRGGCAVAKGLAEVGEVIRISWAKDEAAAKLKRIQPQFVLTMPGGASAITALEIVGAKYVKQIGRAEVGDFVGPAPFIDEQGKVDSRFFAENTGIVAVSKTDGCEGSAFVEEGLLVFAQLRDVLAAKNSPVVTKKNDNGRLGLPQ
jgi:hypothetical protein